MASNMRNPAWQGGMSTSVKSVSHGDSSALKEFAGECAWLLGVQTELMVRFLETGDSAGLEYAVRRGVAYMRALVETMADLQALKNRGASQ